MSKPFKPLLAADADLDNIDWGNVWVSPKLDGIRAIVIDGVVMSRTLKPIPNAHVQALFGQPQFNGLDGELIVGDPTSKSVYHDTYSGVMKAAGTPEVRFHVFDHVHEPLQSYHFRLETALDTIRMLPGFEAVPQHGCDSLDDLLEIEQMYLERGYEGVMIRRVSGPGSHYKYGRSTANEGKLLKLKRFSDSEARVIGFVEEMQNNNVATVDELGRTKRSTHQENLVGKGRLGALICVTDDGIEFNVGGGFTHDQRQKFWEERDTLVGRLVKYKHFAIGVKEAPRFPVFLGFRDPIDM